MFKPLLTRLDSPEQFQTLCFRLARREFPGAVPLNFASWDGGRDILLFGGLEDGELVHEIVWQAKFTDDLGSGTKRAICDSIDTILEHENYRVKRWILCLPVDPTGPFHDWLAAKIAPLGWNWEVWGASILQLKLEANPDVIQTFFFAAYEELRQYFRVEDLQLLDVRLDPECQWSQPDPKVLSFRSADADSPDLVLDVLVQNHGQVDGALLSLIVEIFDWESVLHGLPGEGLLFPQVVYQVGINGGTPGTHKARCEPPLLVKGGGISRFKIRLVDTGFAWRGTIAIGLDHGQGRILKLPAMRIYT